MDETDICTAKPAPPSVLTFGLFRIGSHDMTVHCGRMEQDGTGRDGTGAFGQEASSYLS